MDISAGMEVGHFLIAIISILFLVGVGSMIMSIIYDPTEQQFAPVKKERPVTSKAEIADYYNSIEELTLDDEDTFYE